MAQSRYHVHGLDETGNFEFTWADSHLQAHLVSDVGKKRTHNEDACVVCVPEEEAVAHKRGLLFAVADGMGGVSGGALASRLALQTVVSDYFAVSENEDLPHTIPARLRHAVEEANRCILGEAKDHPEFAGMGTTVTVLVVLGDHAYVAHVGDSRVYLAQNPQSVQQLTDDHSLVAEQVRNGYISHEEARTHSLKNLITRAVGTKEDVKVDLFALQVKHHDTLLLCSDGLSNMLSDREISEALTDKPLPEAARALVAHALKAGGPDNITAVLVRIAEPPEKSKLERGAEFIKSTRTGIFARLKRLLS